MKQILICDDEKEIVDSVDIYLSDAGYKVIKCYRGKEAIEKIKTFRVSIVIMDVMMPEMDGIKTVKKIREFSDVPIIFLSAKSEDTDKIAGLSIGGDDYMTKPFNFLELKTRIETILKRSEITTTKQSKGEYTAGNITLNLSSKTVLVKNKEVKLTPIEFNILKYFMQNVGKVLSSNEIYKIAWDEDAAFNIENTIAVHIRHIRSKISKVDKTSDYIKVVWGIGYKMELN